MKIIKSTIAMLALTLAIALPAQAAEQPRGGFKDCTLQMVTCLAGGGGSTCALQYVQCLASDKAMDRRD